MLNAAVTKVIKNVILVYLDFGFSDVVKRYYDEEVQLPEFPWDCCARLGIQDISKYNNIIVLFFIIRNSAIVLEISNNFL